MSAPTPSTARPRAGRRHDVRVPLPASLPASLHPAVYWQHGGDGPPDVVALHGFRGDHHGLERIVARLPGWRVAVPDLPGFGQSPRLPAGPHDLAGYAAWAAAFVGSVAGRAPVLLGHSFGSIVAAAAVADGLPVRALVLVNPIAGSALAGPRQLLTRATVLVHRFAGALPERSGTALLRHRWFTRVASVAMVKTRDRELRRWIHAEHDRFFGGFADRGALLEAFAASIAHGVDEFAPRVPVPVLLVAAQHDDISTVAQQQRLAAAFPDAQVRVVPGTGHLAHYEAPAAVAAHVTDFVARLGPGESGSNR